MKNNSFNFKKGAVLFSFLLIFSCNQSDKDMKKIFNSVKSGDEKIIDMAQFEKKELDIPYAGNNNPRQILDIIYPLRAKPPCKTIIVIHGGGWAGGHKRCETLAPVFKALSQGYAIVSVNYRLSGEVTWPAPLHDARAAVRFIRANGKKYKLDVKNLVVWGLSAGGHIAQMLAAANNLPAFEDLSPGNEKSSGEVQGVVSWYGVSDISSLTEAGKPYADKIMGFDVHKNREKTRNANPLELVTDQFPLILLVHGTKDEVVPYIQSVQMMKAVNKATGKQTARLIPFIGAVHSDAAISSNDSVAECLNFIDSILYNGKNPYRREKLPVIKTR